MPAYNPYKFAKNSCRLFKRKVPRRTIAPHIKLDVLAEIPRATYGQFIDAILAAKAKCLVDFDGGRVLARVKPA